MFLPFDWGPTWNVAHRLQKVTVHT
jgi:hypothetical protein